jgi:hypothetical protein
LEPKVIFLVTRALAVFIILSATTALAAADPCTQEVLRVEGVTVTIGYCINGVPRADGGDEMIVPVTEAYAAPGGTMRRLRQLHFVAGEGTSRVLESLDLTQLGLSGTLHLTLAYSRGVVQVEGALLTPGAITIK